MIHNKFRQQNINLYINYLLVGYAFCVPISKAGTNFFEITILLLWLFEGNWKYKLSQYKTNPLILTFTIFLGYSLLSVFWASSISDGIDYVAKYRHFLIIAVIYTSLDKKFIKHIFSVFLLSMLISEIMSYGIFLELWKYKNILPNNPSPFMSHMTYSTILAFTSTILLTRVFLNENIKYKILYGVFFVSVTVNLFINGGRTGQIIFVVLILSLFFIHIKSKLKALLLAMIILMTTLILAYNFSKNFNIRMNILSTDITSIVYNNNYTGSGGTRVSLWIVGYYTFIDNFLIGTGINNDMKDIKNYAKEYGFNAKHMSQYGDHHNSFFTLSIKFGIIGLLISFFICYFIYKLKFKTDEYNSLNLMFIISFILFSFTHNTFHTMNAMVFFTLFAGLFNKISNMESTDIIKLNIKKEKDV